MNIYETLSLKFPNADFMYDIKLADLGKGAGPFIKEWNISDVPKPDQATLAQWEQEVSTLYTKKQNDITNAPILKQLDKIDMKSIRAIRTNDTVKMAALEIEAAVLRGKLL
jgi:hypothetical protein